MTLTDTAPTPVVELDQAKVQAFVMKVAGDHAVANNAALAYLGDRLGIWRALATMPATNSTELADRTGLAERYLREWLAAQAAAGYLSYDPTRQRFTLPPEHAMVLADDDSPAALAGEYEVTAAIWEGVERLAHVFATGEGIPWSEQDPRAVTGVERFFRPLYATSLVPQWLPAVDGLVQRLQRGAPRVRHPPRSPVPPGQRGRRGGAGGAGAAGAGVEGRGRLRPLQGDAPDPPGEPQGPADVGEQRRHDDVGGVPMR